ncbi:MAG: DUF4145 domain-containing protein [Clostridium lundense]|nr:DUF4145 domain-containing protein [Clostridium lundense]
MSNFSFLKNRCTSLAKLGKQAESYLYTDNNATRLKMRMFGEQLIDLLLGALKIETGKFATQDDKIKLLRETKMNEAIPDLFDIVRRIGNKANHDGYKSKKDALECLVSMYKVAAWVYIKFEMEKSLKEV